MIHPLSVAEVPHSPVEPIQVQSIHPTCTCVGTTRIIPSVFTNWEPNRRNNNKRQRKSLIRPKRSGNMGNQIAAPMPFQASITVSKKFRFSVPTATTGFVLNSRDVSAFLTIVLGAVGSTSTSASALIDRFKIRRIEVFGPMSQTLAPVTVRLEYLNSSGTQAFSANSKLYSDTSMSSVSAAHLVTAPDPDSLVAKWISGTSTQVELVRFILPANSIVDITIDLVLNDGAQPVGVVLSPAADGGTVGTHPPTGWVSLGLPNLS